jgi:hypothetical protein
MTVVVVAAALLVVVAAGLGAVWSRRRRARRDLEGHFQNEWVNRERWASLADGEQKNPGPDGPDPGRSVGRRSRQ